jgi:hypothetical protein
MKAMDGEQMTKPVAGMSAEALAQIPPSLQAVVDAARSSSSTLSAIATSRPASR